NDDLKASLERFWDVEELLPCIPNTTSLLDQDLEEHFKRHTKIADDGRFIVRIPLWGELNQLGDSMEQAQRRLLSLERRLARHKHTYEDYRKFIREYLELRHMTPVLPHELNKVRYVILHLCVVKPDSTTTMLRVVFDASAKSTTGVSLNDLQAIGPVIQPDLLHVWLHFRMQTVVVTADIAKMYRQVWVAEPDTWMQCILWRDDTTCSAQMYRLCSVTYGEASSSYLVCRVLYEVGEEIRSSIQEIADAIQRSFYVDNLSMGAATKAIKMLGLAWCPTADTFQLIIEDAFHTPVNTLTKRGLVSRITKLYDPVGILQPVIITAKIIMQDLWRDNLKLYERIKDVFGARIRQTRWWTDSQVVLAWIRSDNTKSSSQDSSSDEST
uniref:Peptidase aspartic putative domain-containing protein n=1 Tax=Anopheles epiroticus TaxID=199890 RepID=A0A182PVJ5_9DIPT